MSDHRSIWLAPKCTANSGEGRLWCEDRLDDCAECGDKAVEFIRADIANELLEALEALELQALQSPDLRRSEWGQDALAQARAAILKVRGDEQ